MDLDFFKVCVWGAAFGFSLGVWAILAVVLVGAVFA